MGGRFTDVLGEHGEGGEVVLAHHGVYVHAGHVEELGVGREEDPNFDNIFVWHGCFFAGIRERQTGCQCVFPAVEKRYNDVSCLFVMSGG